MYNRITRRIVSNIDTMIKPSKLVHHRYNQYIGWSFLSNILSSAESALSTHSMLQAVNTPDSDIMRTFNYIGKDIIGQLGGLFFMARIGKQADERPKRFLLYSNIFQQLAFTSVCLSPYFPSYFLPIAGLSNIMFNLSFTGFGAINAKCIYVLSNKSNNTGEIYAKITVINTFGSSIGLLLGLGINILCPTPESRLIFIPVLAIGRVYCFQKAVKHIL